MFGRRKRLFALFGFPVQLDPSWLILLILVVWNLSSGYFPGHYTNLPVSAYWLMGIVGAFGLFLSIILHELSHSWVARHFGLPIGGITLFMFGGVSEMEQEPTSPGVEFLVAVMGPVTSFIIAGLLLLTGWGLQGITPPAVNGVIQYLGFINLVLGIFNLLPAFPMDGGRILRAGIWKWKRSLEPATRIASRVGVVFASIFIALGVISILGGAVMSGLWWVLIGLFLRSSAQMAYEQIRWKELLTGVRIQELMKPNPLAVPNRLSLDKLVSEYFVQDRKHLYPVVDQDHILMGYVQLESLRNFPETEWPNHSVSEITQQCNNEIALDANTDAMDAFSIIARNNSNSIFVTQNNRLIGLVTLQDLKNYISIRQDLQNVRHAT